MQIQVTTRHGHLSEASQEKISAKAEKLTRIFERLTAIDVIVDLTDEATPRVDLKVSAEHKHDFVATEESTNVMAALDGVIHKLEQQLRKYKEKVQDRHRTPGARQQVPARPESAGE